MAVPAGADDVPGELARFTEVEERILATYNSLAEKVDKGELTEAKFADEVSRQILPEWHAAGERMGALKKVFPEQKWLVAKLIEYIKAREEAWTLLVDAIHDQDAKKAEQSKEKQKSVEEIIRQINAKAGKSR
jgi:hypothetical protein